MVLDTSQFGPSCRALVVGLAYAGQVMPLGLAGGEKGKKDTQTPSYKMSYWHKSESICRQAGSPWWLTANLVRLICSNPSQTGTGSFIVRVRGNISVQRHDDTSFMLNQAGLQQGRTRCWHRIRWTAQHHFGPLMLVATWHKGEDTPLYVITNTNNLNAALLVYSWRFWIETLFADFKGRGFHLAHTKIRDPKRLSRLLLAASIAFLWALAVGSFVFHSPQQRLVDRNDRVDRSFFQLGYRTIKRCFKLNRIPDIFFLSQSRLVSSQFDRSNCQVAKCLFYLRPGPGPALAFLWGCGDCVFSNGNGRGCIRCFPVSGGFQHRVYIFGRHIRRHAPTHRQN